MNSRLVQTGVDLRRNGFDLCAKLLLDFVQIEPILVGDQIDGQSKVTEAARTSNPVKIGLRVLGEIEINHNIDRLNINT